MSRLEGAVTRLRLLFARRAAESRMNEEFRFHLEMETEKNIRAGMDAVEARRRAAVAFGGLQDHRETMREGRGLAWVGGWSLDLKLGARMLGKYPGLAIVGGLGMALTTAIGAGAYAVFNTYFYPDLPLHEGDRVVMVANWDPTLRNADSWALHDVVTLRRELRSVVDVGAFRTIRRNLILPTGQGEPINVAEMTAAGFRVARAAPLLGRPLLDSDERREAPPVIVIGHDVWQSRFGSDPAVIGRALQLGRIAHTIVGVMPADFGFPVSHSYWVPLRTDLTTTPTRSVGAEYEVFGRLAPGATPASAQAELAVVRRGLELDRSHPRADLLQPRVLPYTDVFAEGEGGDGGIEVMLMQLLVSMLLVLVALNVAMLVYARTVARTVEIAVRTALGASRARIVTQLFAEAFVLSVLSSLVGLGLVAFGLRQFDAVVAIVSETGRAPFWITPGLSLGTVLYALGLAVLGAVIVGVLPALRATGAQLRSAMVGLGDGAKAQLGPTWTFFIVAQVAMAVMALPPALLKGHELVQQALQDPGFPAEEFLAARYAIDGADGASPATARRARELADSARRTHVDLIARLSSETAVVGATIAERIPGGERIVYIDVEGGATNTQIRAGYVDAKYFEVFGARVVEGRRFGAADAALASHRPVIVNRSFAREYLGGGAAVGRRLRYRSEVDSIMPWLDVVGVVDDFPAGYRNPSESSGRIYHLATPGELMAGIVMVRLRGQTPRAFTPTMQRIATSVDPTLQLPRLSSLDAMYVQRGRLMGLLALVVALLTGSVVLLSAAGIHALMSFTINQRRREIGVRAALGADARRILSGVLARAARQLALGIMVGLALALVFDQYTGGEFMGGQGAIVVPVVATFMLLVGLIAAAGPARRGLRVQPTEALRS